ncbi:MAG: aromatic amino acid lyase [Solirubrobacterales bacterium]|nr:aromatic amino acid lyase [Solirubrobacterales bacterium]MBV9533934.1 aromatic amino acid lyase [Solirubrobacterales bacterium]
MALTAASGERLHRTLLELDGGSLTIRDALEVAKGGREVRLSDRAAEAVRASRELKQSLIAQEIPIYGVTTGLGDSAHRQIGSGKSARLQRNLLRFLGCGTGPTTPPEVVRVSMLLRANCLAKGNSGVRVEVIERLLELLNHDVIPLVPERGSCGASGDLVPLSYVGRALVGETRVAVAGQTMQAAEVLRELGLEALELEAKEGLALTNGTSYMTAFACLAVGAARDLADLVDLMTAMASESLLGNRAHFNAFLFDSAKPHPGMVESARRIRAVLADSGLAIDSDEVASRRLDGADFVEHDRQVQDKYSIRCTPHVNGVLRDVLSWVQQWVTTEMNSSDDNPLFNVGGGRAESGGNFYGGHMGQAMDSLKVAVANVCDLMDRQLELVVDEKFNAGLTPNLIPRFEAEDAEAGIHHGFKGMQLCCSAMTAEAMKLCNPATIHSRSTECHNQDKVSMGAIAARDARTIVELAQDIAAIHLIACCQALDLRGVDRRSPRTQEAVALVRERVPFLDGDRYMDEDIATVVEMIRAGVFSELVPAGA